MRLRVVASAYAIWLFAIEWVFYLVSGNNENALQFVVMAGAVPAALQLLLLGVETRGLVIPVQISLAFLLVILFSYLGTTADWMPLIYLINTTFLFTVGVFVAGSPDRQLLRLIAAIFSVVSGIFLVFVDFTGEYLWDRLTAHEIQPNFWGIMGLTVGVTAFAHKKASLALACIGAAYLTIMDASARGSLTAMTAAMLLIGALFIRDSKGARFVAILGGMVLGLVLLLLLIPHYSDAVYGVLGDLLKLDDPDRGLGHGFTGRDVGWSEAIDLWKNSPLFGVGFRQHEALLVNITSAHNAYLSMLADTGIFGFILYCVFITWALFAAFSIADRNIRNPVLAILLSYAVIGLFERRAINSGNPFGVLFIMTCFYSLADQQLRRVGHGAVSRMRAPMIASEGLAEIKGAAR